MKIQNVLLTSIMILIAFLWTLILIVFYPYHDPCVKFMVYFLKCVTGTFFFLWIGFCLCDCILNCSFFPVICFVCLCPFVDPCPVIGCAFFSLLTYYDSVCVSLSNHPYLFCLVFPPVWPYEFLPFPPQLPSR